MFDYELYNSTVKYTQRILVNGNAVQVRLVVLALDSARSFCPRRQHLRRHARAVHSRISRERESERERN